MAKKKKVLTDNDYEEFNKMMAEYEASPISAKVRFAHDDGSIWYEGMRGGHGDRDFVRHRLHYPAVPFSVMLESDALGRFRDVVNNESSSFEDLFQAYKDEARKLDPGDKPIKPEDLDNCAALALEFASALQQRDHDDMIISLCSFAAQVFSDLAQHTPLVYSQYVVASLDLMSSAYLWTGQYMAAEKGYLEVLDICRNNMAKYGPVDWTAHLIYQYWHIGGFYHVWGKEKKAIAYYEEGWRTFVANNESAMADAVYGISNSLGQFYEQNGMTHKLQMLQSEIEDLTSPD